MIRNAKNDDIITFDSSLKGKTITLGGSELIIDKNITIDATNTNITIDANKKSRVMNIASGITVEIVGLTFKGGLTTGNGGAINNAGVLYLYDCDIVGNEAKRGGGVASTGTTTIIGGTISGNTSHSYGGGVYVQSGITTITDCIITGNKMAPVPVAGGAVSGGSGGGVYFDCLLLFSISKYFVIKELRDLYYFFHKLRNSCHGTTILLQDDRETGRVSRVA